MIEVPFGGRQALEEDEAVPLEAALKATNCYVDFRSVRPRNGYIALTAAAVGSGTVQHIGRFRPDRTTVRTVMVRGGEVWTITDPSSRLLSDGSAVSLGTPFADTDIISGAQLGTNYYLGTSGTAAARRIKWTTPETYALESLERIPQGSKPTNAAFGAISFTLFKDLAAPDDNACVFGTSGIPAGATNWRSVTLTGANDDPLVNAYCDFTLGANFDARAYDWLVVAITPRNTGNANGAVTIEVGSDSGGSPVNLTSVGVIYDVPPIGGSPNLIFCSLQGLVASVRSAVRHIRFTNTGSSGGKYGLYGYAFLPAPPLAIPEKYYVSFQNSATGQESELTEALDVTIRDQDKLNLGTPPTLTYVNCYLETTGFLTTSGNDDILSGANRRVFNREAGKVYPTLKEIGAVVTINGTSPAVTGPDLVRLWKQTDGGIRLVGTAAYPGASTAYSVADTIGLGILSNTLYKAGGTPPTMIALAAHAGRLIALYQNDVYVSSFIPVSATTNPYPQFPSVPVEDADGHRFSVSPTKAEQGQIVVEGDDVYVLTSGKCYVMPDMGPFTLQWIELLNRGCLGAAAWIENRLIWVAYDGVYTAANRVFQDELTKSIRRLFIDTFAPDSTVQLGYKRRKLYVTKGTSQMRYDFVTETWTGPHTIAHTVSETVSWTETV